MGDNRIGTQWEVIVLEGGERHVIPLEDLKEHDEEEECWCRPFEDDGIIVHNALDRREQYERKERLPS